MFGKKREDPRANDERPHPYKAGFGHASYCVALMPSGIHCGRPAVDPVHVPDPNNPLRRRG